MGRAILTSDTNALFSWNFNLIVKNRRDGAKAENMEKIAPSWLG